MMQPPTRNGLDAFERSLVAVLPPLAAQPAGVVWPTEHSTKAQAA